MRLVDFNGELLDLNLELVDVGALVRELDSGGACGVAKISDLIPQHLHLAVAARSTRVVGGTSALALCNHVVQLFAQPRLLRFGRSKRALEVVVRFFDAAQASRRGGAL